MKVIIPESLNEITLKQYLDFKTLVDADKYKEHELVYHKVSIFTNLNYAQCRNIGVKDLADLSVLIDNAIETDYEFQQNTAALPLSYRGLLILTKSLTPATIIFSFFYSPPNLTQKSKLYLLLTCITFYHI